MSAKVNYIITKNNITVNYLGQTHIVSRNDKLANQLIEAIKKNRLSEIPDLVDKSKQVEKYGKGDFQVKDGAIFLHGVAVPNVLSRKILSFMNEGLPHQPLINFAKNLQKNPSYRAVQELFGFLDKNDHPITEDGKFIAYKKVGQDFKDLYSSTFDNSPGETVSMDRNQVDEDCNKTCSNGLHVANWYYASDVYGSKRDVMLEVEVDPADVVSIPVDYENAKMRVCKYKVIGTVDQKHSDNDHLRPSSEKNRTEKMPSSEEDEEEQEEEEERLCSRCFADVPEGYGGENNFGELLCDDCEEEGMCGQCGEYVYDDDEEFVYYQGEYLCEPCYESAKELEDEEDVDDTEFPEPQTWRGGKPVEKNLSPDEEDEYPFDDDLQFPTY